MLLKRLRSVQARCRHGRPSYVRVPCPNAVVVCFARRRIHAAGHSISLFARLDPASKCFSNPHRRLASRSVYERPDVSVDCTRISTRHTRSSVAYDSHDEASSVDDGCCTANFNGDTDVSVGLRPTEALHQEPDPPRQSDGAMVRDLSSASGVVLASGHRCRNRMASSPCVSVGHALPPCAYFGGRDLSDGWPAVLVARSRVFTECGEVASVVHGDVLVSCNFALRHSFRILRVL